MPSTSFIRFLAVERGLSENYQLSTQRSLTEFANWCVSKKRIDNFRGVTLPLISEYLGRPETGGVVRVVDQINRGRAEDFLSLPRGEMRD